MHVVSIGRLLDIGLRWPRRRVRVGVVEPDDFQPQLARHPPCFNVIPWIDEKSVDPLVQIPRSNGSHDSTPAANQEPAALRRRRLARMRDDGIERFALDTECWKA